MKQIIEWSKGNPGAMSFLMQLILPENATKALPIVMKLQEAKSIRGTDLYVLWSDICGKDLGLVETLCRQCPTPILEDACSRQDYSGKALVAQYLKP